MEISNIRAIRLLKGLRIYQVSSMTGINTAKLSYAERNLCKLSEAEMNKLCGALGVKPEDLFPTPNEAESSKVPWAK